jgi:hypothetical protein
MLRGVAERNMRCVKKWEEIRFTCVDEEEK